MNVRAIEKQITIRTTLGAVLTAEPAIERLATLRLPVKVAYHLAKLLKGVKAETQLFLDQRNAFIKELGVERATTEAERAVNGGATSITKVKPEHWAEYAKRVQELTEVDVTIPWGPIDLAMLETAEVTGKDLADLGPFLFDGAVESQEEPRLKLA